MKHTCLVQRTDAPAGSVKTLLAHHLAKSGYDHLNAAMAYVTIAGIRDVLGLLANQPMETHWVVGLDDAVTQPGAIELCLSFANSHVRVASFERENRRFHPKVLYLHDSKQPRHAMMMLGSANLTKKALAGNAESVVLLEAETLDDKAELNALWRDAWSLGRELAKGELVTYSLKFDRSKRLRKKALADRLGHDVAAGERKERLVLDDDHAEVDPAKATTCWIECGNVTLMGRELEFKAEQGLFFGLNPHGEAPKFLKYIVSDGSEVTLRMKYQGNHMWRLQMSPKVPEVATGLRPTLANGRLGRSQLVAVFERTPSADTFALRFVNLASREFRVLRQRSIDHGTKGATAAREYGWF